MSKYIKDNSTLTINDIFQKSGIAIICLYLAALFPATQLFGSLPIQRISLLLLLAHGVVTIVYTAKSGIIINSYMKWYGLFAVVSFVSLSISNGDLTNDDFRSVIICLVLTVILSFYIKDDQTFKSVCWCYSIVCLVNAMILLINNEMVLDAGERLGERLDINSNVLATYLMYGIIYSIWLMFVEKGKRKKIILMGIIVIISYPLILTGGRKFFVAPIIFLIIALIVNAGSRGKDARIKIICGIVIMLVILWYLIMNIPVLYNSLGNRMEGLLNSYTGKGKTEASALERSQLRNLAINGWLTSPIWGHGFDMFKYFSRNNGMPFFYSHCNITELLYNGGLICFCAYYWFFGMIIWQCYTNKKMSTKQKALCIAGIITQLFFDYGCVTYNLYESQLFLLMIYCAMNIFPENESIASNSKNLLIRNEYC